jgi:CheY-like chemotaxis protein
LVMQAMRVSSRGPRSIPIDSTLGLRHPLRILLAEDNVINQKVALLLLQRAGYRADVAANGQEVLDAVTVKAYDLIFMDVQMPEMDGLEAARRLRGPGPWLGKPRIVAMTADVMRERREACVVVGMDDFVAKPIRVQELTRVLEQTAKLRTNESVAEDAWQPGTEAELQEIDEIVIDEGAFHALRTVCALEGSDALSSLVSEFVVDSGKILDDLSKHIENADWSMAERLAHTLKGTSGVFGALGLSEEMAKTEHSVRQRATSELTRLLAGARVEHARVVDALRRKISN